MTEGQSSPTASNDSNRRTSGARAAEVSTQKESCGLAGDLAGRQGLNPEGTADLKQIAPTRHNPDPKPGAANQLASRIVPSDAFGSTRRAALGVGAGCAGGALAGGTMPFILGYSTICP